MCIAIVLILTVVITIYPYLSDGDWIVTSEVPEIPAEEVPADFIEIISTGEHVQKSTWASGDNSANIRWIVMCDQDTGVEYLIVRWYRSDSVTITPLYNPDGTLKVHTPPTEVLA
jgi:hypothetical protein